MDRKRTKIVKKINILIILVFITVLFCNFNIAIKANTVFNQDNQKLFNEANEFYTNQQYFKAIELYEKLLNSGIYNGTVYYNLANSYFKNEQLGKAILNYKNALIFQPRNADIKANLSFVIDSTPDQISTEESMDPMLRVLIFWYYNLNLEELIYLTIVFNVLVCSGLIFGFIYKNFVLKASNYIGIIILVILLISSGIKLYKNYHPDEGVIVVNETEVKSANGNSYATLFKLHEGTVFNIEDQKENWYKISLSNGQKGWVLKDSIGLINARM
ncbi:MAG: SH3 domain-containing protein [Cyanobacteriota bacterium]